MTDYLDDDDGRAWTEVDRRRIILAAVATVLVLGFLWFQSLRDGGGGDPVVEGPEGDWPTSDDARDDVPRGLLVTYQEAAATCPGLPWPVVAAIGKVETDHDRTTEATPGGAQGPMQFLPATWERFQADGDQDGIADVNDPQDAVYGAARLLCRSGGDQPAGLRDAIFAYNRSDSYVDQVLRVAAAYTTSSIATA
jgi:hypothetical protein